MDITRRTLIGALGAALGSVGIAAATGANSTKTTSQHTEHESEQDSETDDGESDTETGQDSEQNGEQDASDNENDGESDSGSETDEKSFTQADVSRTPTDAKTAAMKKVSGSVSGVSLENHDGSPVYQVIVKTASGTSKQVTVDANTGDVVKVESASED